MTFNIENAITGVSPNFTIDFAKLSFSVGTLPEALSANIVIDNPATVKYACGLTESVRNSWLTGIEDNTNIAGSRDGDGVYHRIRHKRTIHRYADWLN